MKALILCDTHHGIKNGHELFLEQSSHFLSRMIDYCKENNINRILHLGDFFDNRRQISFRTLEAARESFLDLLEANDIYMDIVPGNHDVTYRNTNNLNSLREILVPGYEDYITLHMDPVEIDLDGMLIGMVPWITADNADKCFDFIQNTKATFLMGHFEITGFRYIANSSILSKGLDQSLFNRFEQVISGHFHTKSQNRNIMYLGSPFQMNWGDAEDRKYFHVLDTSDRSITPVENDDKIFQKVLYSDNDKSSLDDFDWSHSLQRKFVRIIVETKQDHKLFDQFLDRVRSLDPYDLKILENLDIESDSSTDDEDIQIENTEQLLFDYIDSLDIQSSDQLKSFLHDLYLEAFEQL